MTSTREAVARVGEEAADSDAAPCDVRCALYEWRGCSLPSSIPAVWRLIRDVCAVVEATAPLRASACCDCEPSPSSAVLRYSRRWCSMVSEGHPRVAPSHLPSHGPTRYCQCVARAGGELKGREGGLWIQRRPAWPELTEGAAERGQPRRRRRMEMGVGTAAGTAALTKLEGGRSRAHPTALCSNHGVRSQRGDGGAMAVNSSSAHLAPPLLTADSSRVAHSTAPPQADLSLPAQLTRPHTPHPLSTRPPSLSSPLLSSVLNHSRSPSSSVSASHTLHSLPPPHTLPPHHALVDVFLVVPFLSFLPHLAKIDARGCAAPPLHAVAADGS